MSCRPVFEAIRTSPGSGARAGWSRIGSWCRQRSDCATPRSVDDHAPDALALMHQVETFVDVLKRHRVRDHRIDLDLAVHVPVDDLGAFAAWGVARRLVRP